VNGGGGISTRRTWCEHGAPSALGGLAQLAIDLNIDVRDRASRSRPRRPSKMSFVTPDALVCEVWDAYRTISAER